MGKPDLLTKLSNKLGTVPTSEEDIIYILSRVRKILELENHPSEYAVLNFYCNLALHAKIDQRIPKEISEGIIKSHTDFKLQHPHPFLGYPHFHKQLAKFSSGHKLPDFYKLNNFKMTRFIELLNSIYSDTPVIVDVTTQYQAIVNKGGSITSSILE